MEPVNADKASTCCFAADNPDSSELSVEAMIKVAIQQQVFSLCSDSQGRGTGGGGEGDIWVDRGKLVRTHQRQREQGHQDDGRGKGVRGGGGGDKGGRRGKEGRGSPTRGMAGAGG